MPLNKMEVLGLLQEHGAVVDGHFQLASGLHSPVYIRTALVLQYPHVAQRIARALTAKFPQNIDVVISPGTGSLVLGQEVARLKKCRAIFVERSNGMVALRRDFRLERGERALIVQDVMTTGRLTAEVVSLAQAYGAKAAGVAAIVDRSTSPVGLCLPVPVRTLISYPLQVTPTESCPQCRSGVPLTDVSKNISTGAVEGE